MAMGGKHGIGPSRSVAETLNTLENIDTMKAELDPFHSARLARQPVHKKRSE